MNLAFWLQQSATSFGSLPSIAVGATTIRSYRESARRVMALAGGLRNRLSLNDGDRVAILARNGPDYAETLYAIWWAGLVAVPINAKLHPTEVSYILEHSGSKAVFISEDQVSKVSFEGPVIEFESALHQQLAEADGMPCKAVDTDDLAWLFYTSGTTGRPKGAMLSHRNMQAMTWAYFACIDQLQPGDALLHAAPMSHGSGIYILPHLARGCCQVIPESGGFEPGEIMETMAHWPGTSMFAAPTMVNRLTRYGGDVDTRNMRSMIYGGGPMYVEDAQAALARLGPKLVQIYGQGESPMNISCLEKASIANTTQDRYLERLGSVGRAFPNVDLRITGEDGKALAIGEVGEVTVMGESVMLGYWQNAEATADTIRDGWLHTGDIGRLDEDGYLTLMDRSKDLVISGGTNIYPREIEEVLLTHPGVDEVSIIGRRDSDWGEVVVAYVVGTAKPQELDALCLEKIARFKRPKDYIFIDSLPKNNYGKVLKTDLRERDLKR